MDSDKSRILEVVDEAIAREVMQRALAQFGYHRIVASDAVPANC